MRHCCHRTLFWIMLMVVFLHVMSVAGQQCVLHESKHSERCCIKRTIGKGYQPVMCDVDGGMISTEPCPANTYQSKEYSSVAFHMCDKHTSCTSPFMVTVTNGNSTSNTVCQCNEAGGYYDPQSDTTRPLAYNHCILRTATVSMSSSVHQSTPVHQSTSVNQSTPIHSVPSEYPADTSASATDYYVIWIVIGLAAFILVVIVAVAIICFRNRLRKYWCNQGKNETAEVSSINVVNQAGMPHNGHISDPNHAAETDARLLLNSIENSYAQNEDENGSQTSGNFDLRSDSDDSQIFSSLCHVDMGCVNGQQHIGC